MSQKEKLVFFLLVLIVSGFGTYKLTESPPVWIDEGMVTQLALNTERHGIVGLQTSPGNFASGAYISVGFPVTLSLAGVFGLMGEGILQARALMIVWVILLVALSYGYILKEFGAASAALGGLLIATFAPLYGNGKNVLGEVPGLVFLFLFLLLLQRLDHDKFSNKPGLFFLTGFILGLVIATKPIFLLLLGAVFIASIWSSLAKSMRVQIKSMIIAGLGAAIPLIIWFFTQFYRSDSFWDIFAFYRNPYDIKNISTVTLENFLRFFTELSPLYTAFFFALWGISVVVREWRRTDRVSIAEKTAFVFSLLVLSFYLRTPGWYRYFFPAQIVILAFLPQALFFLGSYISLVHHRIIRFGLMTAIFGLVVFQTYQTGFNSWVADYYDSTRTKDLEEYFRNWNPGKSIFVYNAPETVVFIPRDTGYYQFLEINKGRTIGQAELERIAREPITNAIILSLDEDGKYPEALFQGYKEKDRVNRYVILEAKK